MPNPCSSLPGRVAKGISAGVIVALVSACTGSPLTRAPSTQPSINFDSDAMDGALACLTQHVRDSNALGLGDAGLFGLTLRVGKFPDRSGKTSPAAPSDNPRRLQSYFQGAVAQSGLFTLSAIDDGAAFGGDLPQRPGGTGHAPSDNVATLLLSGVLDGDADVSNRSAEASLSIGPLELLLAGNDRVVGQRLYAEIVNSAEGTVVYRNVDDPYTGTRRRMHLAVTTNLVLPETGFRLGGSWFGSSGDGGIGSLGGDVKLARIKALTLASKAVWFELLRRMTNAYAASERCLAAHPRAEVAFPKRLEGVVLGPIRSAAAQPRTVRPQAARPQAVQPRAAQPSVARPRAAEPRQAAPAPSRPAATPQPSPPRAAAPQSAIASYGGGAGRPVSLVALDPGRGGRADFAAFRRGLPAGLRDALGQGSAIGLFNAAGRVLETPGSGRVLRVAVGGRWADLVAGAPVRRPPEGPGLVCRRLSLVASSGARVRLEACRDPRRPVWRFNTPS